MTSTKHNSSLTIQIVLKHSQFINFQLYLNLNCINNKKILLKIWLVSNGYVSFVGDVIIKNAR